ncbi:head decoration protein [Paracoccus spongiarum]|uniref:Head decoration protein n=1 Tax=Paracoccus spongiarum TaxID=3064387 RepID=A0ABT9JF53_9RHOB|nr:head decoration protein [Paracoccus sp. 2205BS29-5]MDP5308442.1 head decoration protein [Paracoccus sp. 2205BS29-5]
MPVLTQPPSMGDALKYELNPNYSRETVTLAEGLQYPAGAVLGRITTSGQHTFASHGGSDGAEVAVGILLYPVDSRLAEATGILLARGPAILSRAALFYDGSVDDAAKIAAKHAELTALGIVIRDSA